MWRSQSPTSCSVSKPIPPNKEEIFGGKTTLWMPLSEAARRYISFKLRGLWFILWHSGMTSINPFKLETEDGKRQWNSFTELIVVWTRDCWAWRSTNKEVFVRLQEPVRLIWIKVKIGQKQGIHVYTWEAMLCFSHVQIYCLLPSWMASTFLLASLFLTMLTKQKNEVVCMCMFKHNKSLYIYPETMFIFQSQESTFFKTAARTAPSWIERLLSMSLSLVLPFFLPARKSASPLRCHAHFHSRWVCFVCLPFTCVFPLTS